VGRRVTLETWWTYEFQVSEVWFEDGKKRGVPGIEEHRKVQKGQLNLGTLLGLSDRVSKSGRTDTRTRVFSEVDWGPGDSPTGRFLSSLCEPG